MSNTKKVLATVKAQKNVKVLKPTDLLQIKGGTGSTQETIVIEDILNI